MTTDASQAKNQPEFAIQRLYAKDLSLEAPNTPLIFKEEWQPELNIDMQTTSTRLEEDIYEVVLAITVTVKSKDKVAFLVEVKEAGIFLLKNFPEDQMGPMLGSVCPTIIFPYAREVISDVVVRAGFPQLCLAPVNFDALYAQHMQNQATGAANQAVPQSDEPIDVH
jgi:preprotein translocase subunit SecB